MLRKLGMMLGVAAAAIFLVSGCGGGGNPVRGTVRVRDGEVVRQGTVQFISNQATASGRIREDGSYQLSGAGEADGAPPGTYTVVFLGTQIGGGYDSPDEPIQEVIHPKYADAATSPIQVEVPAGGAVHDFELDPPE